MLGSGWTEVIALAAAYVVAVLATPAGISGAVLLLHLGGVTMQRPAQDGS